MTPDEVRRLRSFCDILKQSFEDSRRQLAKLNTLGEGDYATSAAYQRHMHSVGYHTAIVDNCRAALEGLQAMFPAELSNLGGLLELREDAIVEAAQKMRAYASSDSFMMDLEERKKRIELPGTLFAQHNEMGDADI